MQAAGAPSSDRRARLPCLLEAEYGAEVGRFDTHVAAELQPQVQFAAFDHLHPDERNLPPASISTQRQPLQLGTVKTALNPRKLLLLFAVTKMPV